uniref:Platelet-activating factor acetylhydrolase n=1 Tax=Mola mola TaxID=94237 RepID=A0A3Q3XDD9_MOLML
MGNSRSNPLGIPPAKGPNVVGCTDFMGDHTAQGSFIRLYYPCQQTDKARKPDWVPCREYFNGLADFMKINRTLSEKIFNYFFGSFKIPACLDAPFKPNGRCPVVIFSHGLGAFRTLYSTICTELASQGFIVASVEHRDESASATYYFCKKTENVPMPPDNLVKEWMYYRPLQQEDSEFTLRNRQVRSFSVVCLNCYTRLFVLWITPLNSMDLGRIAAMGHSFGGATVIEALSKEARFKCGIALDAWMFPLDDKIFPQVKQPVFFINSERFQWVANINQMGKLDSAVTQRKMITIRGTVHQSFTDFTFLTGKWFGKLMKLKGEIDPELAIDLSNKATLAFLQRHLGLEKKFNQWDPLIDGQDEDLIEGTNVTVLQSAI